MLPKLVLLLSITLVVTQECPTAEFGQCGGQGWQGPTCCKSFDNCTVINTYYSQCQPKDLCLVVQFGQCGGIDGEGKPWPAKKSCCPPSFECQYQSKYYSQCVPVGSNHTNCAEAWKQCGGKDPAGNPWGTLPSEKTCCIPGYECDVKDPVYYSQCAPMPICTNARYGQCGGIDAAGHPWTKEYKHDSCCPDAFSCTFKSQYYSQCTPINATLIEDLVEAHSS